MKSLKIFRHWAWSWLLSYLSKPVTLEQVITIDSLGRVKLDGQVVSASELHSLQEEIRAFQTMRLSTILINLPKALAQQRMFEDSKSWDDMLAGKLMLYNVSIQENAMLGILSAPQGNQPVTVQPNPYKPK